MNTLPRLFSALTIATSLGTFGCTGALKPADGAKIQNLDPTLTGAVSGVTDVASAREKAKSLGYLDDSLCTKGLRGGEEVLFSTNHSDEVEYGQASGVLVSRDGGLFFEQRKSQRNLIILAPGVTSWTGNGVAQTSSWEFKTYFELLCRVAFDVDGLKAGMRYDTAAADIVDLRGGTAGLTIAYQDLMRVVLHKNGAPREATFTLYLKKGFGPVAIEYIESWVENAGGLNERYTFRMYLNDKGGSGVGTHVTLSPREQKCADLKGFFVVDDHSFRGGCYGEKTQDADADSCKKSGAHWFGGFGEEPQQGCYREISL